MSELQKANTFLREGKFKQAIEIYQQALTGCDNNMVRNQLSFNIKMAERRIAHLYSSSESGQMLGKQRAILYIVHDGSGGMIHTSFDLLKGVSDSIKSYLLKAGKKQWIIYESQGSQVLIKQSIDFEQDWSETADLNDNRVRVFCNLLDELCIVLVHIRVLFGSGLKVIEVCNQRQIPVVFSFHDFSAICPNIQLIDNGKFCGGYCDQSSESDCSYPKKWLPEIERLKNSYRKIWGEKNEYSINRCQAYVVTSPFAIEVITNNFKSLDKSKFNLIEHGRDFFVRGDYSTPYRQGSACNIIFLGALNEAKGCKLVGELLKINKSKKIFRFHIIGNIFNKRYENLYSQFEEAVLYGQYERDEIASHFERIRPTLTILPSIWPETYSHVLTESWAYGIPVLGSSLGAIGDRITQTGGGWTCSPSDPKLWYETMLRVVKDLDNYNNKRLNVKGIIIKSENQMTTQYVNLYNKILEDCKSKTPTDLAQESNVDSNGIALGKLFKIKQVRLKMLELGFYAAGIRDLEKFSLHDDTETQCSAKWELALYYASSNGNGHKQKAYDYLKSIPVDKLDIQSKHKYAILFAECLCELVNSNEASQYLNKFVESYSSADLYLCKASVITDLNEKIYWMNRALSLSGIAGLDANTINIVNTGNIVHKFDILNNVTFDRAVETVRVGPKITVILPVYNSENTIKTSLDSILNQSWKNLEIIAVDDCSSDNSILILNHYASKDERIKILQTSFNSGPYVARNTALEVATGDYITCHDADDWSHPEKLSTQVTHLINNKNICANISQWARIRNDLSFNRRGNPGFYIQPNLSSLMISRNLLINEFGYWDSVRFGADTELINRILKAKGMDSIAILDNSLLAFARTHESSLTESKTSGYPGYPFGSRREYRESYLAYYAANKDDWKISFPLENRKFMAPSQMHIMQDHTISDHFQFVIVADFRDSDQVDLCLQIINQRLLLNEKIAIVNIPSYKLKYNLPVSDEIRDLLNSEKIFLATYGDQLLADLLIIASPAIFEEHNSYVPVIKSIKTNVLVSKIGDNTIEDIADLRQCRKNIATHFKGDSTWYRIGDSMHILSKPVFPSGLPLPLSSRSRFTWFQDIEIICVDQLKSRQWKGPEVIVIMPCIDANKGLQAARVLRNRAGMECKILVVMDSLRQGFIKTFNQAASRVKADFIVYCAQDAIAGKDWLKNSHNSLIKNQKSLLAFNDGKWHGRIASFGMIRSEWIKNIYPPGNYLFGGYNSHKADNEITVIARALDQFIYEPNSVLMEVDFGKDFGGSNSDDNKLFDERFRDLFGGILARDMLTPYANDYHIKDFTE